MIDIPKQYGFALIGEAWDIFKEWIPVVLGLRKMTNEEVELWNKRRETIHKAIQEVRNKHE